MAGITGPNADPDLGQRANPDRLRADLGSVRTLLGPEAVHGAMIHGGEATDTSDSGSLEEAPTQDEIRAQITARIEEAMKNGQGIDFKFRDSLPKELGIPPTAFWEVLQTFIDDKKLTFGRNGYHVPLPGEVEAEQ